MPEAVVVFAAEVDGCVLFGRRMMLVIVTMMMPMLLRAAMMTVLRVSSHGTTQLTVHTVMRVHMLVVLSSLLALLVADHELISDEHEGETSCQRKTHVFAKGLCVEHVSLSEHSFRVNMAMLVFVCVAALSTAGEE